MIVSGMPTSLAPAPQLLTRAAAPPNGDAWLYEIKYDGFRLLANLGHGRASLWSRPGAEWTSRLPWIANAVAALKARSACLDGELVYLTDDGFPDFEALQDATRSGKNRERLFYQVFDVLNLDGVDLTSRPLLERKARLMDLLRAADSPRLRFVAHTRGNGADFFRAVDQLGLEGIVCKKARSVYRAGVRTSDWVKVKCFRTQRFTVVGYTIEDNVLASLALAGVVSDGSLVYAGRVEFGVPRRDDTVLRALRTLGDPTMAVAGGSQSPSVIWVEPKLSAEVRALAWQPGRSLRHAALRGVSVASSPDP